jgi:hypothetical protein
MLLAGWFAGDRAKGLDGTLESRDLKWCRDDVSVVDRLQQELQTPDCGAAGIDSLGRSKFIGLRHHFLWEHSLGGAAAVMASRRPTS